jgi:hypothetical protein
MNKPRIIAATKPCSVARDGSAAGATFNWRYRATCRRALAPGKTFNIHLTTSSGSGKVDVFVVVDRVLVHLGN